MNALDLVDTGSTCQMLSNLIRTDKDIDDLIAETLHSLIKMVRTPAADKTEFTFGFTVHCAIGEELLVRRARANYAVTAKTCA